MTRSLFLSARTHESRDVAIRRLLDSIGELGFVLGTRSFSGLLLVLDVELPRARLAALGERLRAIRVPLEADSEARLAEPQGDDPEVSLVLDVAFVDGDPNLRQPVPAVPG